MRTLKKTLCLVLVLAMMLGLGVVSVSADAPEYSDSDAITYKEAVDVLSTLGVLKGDEGGFRPTDELTRAEGCAIIVRLLGMDGVKGTAPFTDTVGHWAESEIAYCAREGIVNGIGENLFDPDGKLTGSMFAKMLLGCLGYDAEIEGMTGPQWQITVAKLIREADLDHGIANFDQPANITREEAAQLGLNTLIAPTVKYSNKGSTVAVNGAEITFGASTAEYVTSVTNGAQTISNNTLSDNSAIGKPIVEYAEDKWPDLVIVGQGFSMNDLGRPVRQWTYKGAEIGTYVGQDMQVATYTKKVTAKDLYDLLGKGRYDSLRSSSSNGQHINSYKLYSKVNGLEQAVVLGGTAGQDLFRAAYTATAGTAAVKEAAGQDTIDLYVNRTNTTKVNGSDNGSVTEVYINEDDLAIYLVTYDTWVFKASGDYKASSDSINITPAGDTDIVLDSNRLDGIDFPQIKDYKDGDYLLITATHDSANARYGVETVDKAELVTGTVSEFSYNSSYNVTIDGTKYSYSKNCKDADDDDVKKTTYTIGQKATVVLDKYGYIIDVDEASGVENYVFIEDWGTSSSLNADARAKAYFADGSDAEISVKSAWNYTTGAQETASANIIAWNSTTNGGTALNQNWFKYSRGSDGKYTLNRVDSTYSVANASFTGSPTGTQITDNNKVQFFSSGTLRNRYINDNSVIVVNDTGRDTVTTYTGLKNAPEIILYAGATADAYVAYKTSNSYCNLIFVTITGTADVTGSDGEQLLYVTEYNAAVKGSDNEDYHVYKVLKEDGSDTESVQADTQITTYTGKYFGAAYYVSRNSKDQLTNFRAVGDKAGVSSVFGTLGATSVLNPVKYNDGAVTVAGTRYTVDKDAKIYLITMGSTSVWRPTSAYGAAGTYGVNASVLNNDSAATFETMVGTGTNGARALAAALEGYSYTYDVAGKKTSSTSSIINELYVTVTRASALTTLSSTATAAQITTALANSTNLKFNGNMTLDAAKAAALAGTADEVYVDGNLTVSGNATIDYALRIDGTLTVNSGVTMNITTGSVTVGGNTYVNGTLTVGAGGVLDTSNVTVTSNTSLHIYGKATISGSLTLTDNGKLTIDSGSNTVEIDSLVVEQGVSGVTITSGTVEIETLSNEATVTINGGTITVLAIENGTDNNAAAITVSGGTVSVVELDNDGVVNSVGGTMTAVKSTGDGTTSGVTLSFVEFTVKFDGVTGVDVTSSSGATYSDGVYTIAGDTATVSLVLTNSGDEDVTVTVTPSNDSAKVDAESYTVSAGSTATVTVDPKDTKYTGNFDLTVAEKADTSEET